MNILTNADKRCEIVLKSDKTYANPFLDVEIDAVFTHDDGTSVSLPGFWNGGNEWKVRFSPNKPGRWNYTVTCTDTENLSLTAEGFVEAGESEKRTELEKHGYVTLQPGKRFFTYADGTPFFWLGDTHWQMPDYERLHECNYPGCTCGNQFRHLVDDRVKKGFTVYQTYFDSAESDGGGNKRVHHWWAEKYTLINPQAFNESMDIMMEYLAEQGMTVAMGFGVHSSTTQAYKKVEPLLAFARYCVARYACYPVVWITGQEVSADQASWKPVGELVSKLDGYHRPNGAHMYPMVAADPRARELNDTDWHQWWTLQAGHGGMTRLQPRSLYQSYYDCRPTKPFVETECHYEDLYCGGFNGYDAPRVGAWQAMQCGSAGFTYGVTGVWAMEWNATDDRGWLSYSPEPWYIGMDKPGSTEMTYLRKFYEYVGFQDLTPAFGHEYGSFEMRKYVAISHRGSDVFIFYFFGDSPETGLIAGLDPQKTYQMRWYDNVTGKFVEAGSVQTADGTMPVPEMPSRRADWVLLLSAVDLGPYETEEFPADIRPIAASEAKLGAEIPFASLHVSSEDPEHPGTCLNDGREDTFWRGLAPCTSQTILMDLGQEEELGYLSMICNMPTMRFIRYRVMGSHDGENFELISERMSDRVAVGGVYPVFHDPLKGTYRYVRLFLSSALITPALELTKLAIYKKQD